MSEGINDSSASRIAVELGVWSDVLVARSEHATFIWFVADGVLCRLMLGICGSVGCAYV